MTVEFVLAAYKWDFSLVPNYLHLWMKGLGVTMAYSVGTIFGGMVIGMPIAQALVLTGVALMWHLDMFDAQILAQNVITGADSFPLLAVPFFMLAGEIMNVGGLSDRKSTRLNSSHRT